MPIIGVYARVEGERAGAVRRDLGRLDGVSTFELGDREKVGILVEAVDLDSAHQIVTRVVPAVQGVLGVWPVYVNNEDGLENRESCDTEQPVSG